MLAAYYTRQGRARDVLHVTEVNTPMPRPGEVRVKLFASGINPADVKRRAGATARPMVFPIVIPHSDGSGVIDAVGAGVPPAREGERVWIWNAQWCRAFGTAAEFITLPSAHAVPLPAAASFDVGAAIGVPGLTAHRCISALGNLHGRAVLVYGAGGAVGHLVVQLAKARGAIVVGVVRSASKCDALREAGADACLVSNDAGFAEAAIALATPRGFDHIVDVDFAANSGLYTTLLAKHGSVVAFGSASEMRPAVDVLALQKHGITLHFISGAEQPASLRDHAIEEINHYLAGGRLAIRIEPAYSLRDIVNAHEHVEAGGLAGKVLLHIAAQDASG